ncbi:hypothetical protein [Roseivirga sp. E12]|uniref:hypothetical protein n=1 Tax=Roseivirga sp. E12 TaxID=2819237 RepID=UPI001ABC3FEF|nr:hypothetical protein [Roseivirga sp. E12]MBO3697534.1 hypothetical protein [Roseivirga sp. E12]
MKLLFTLTFAIFICQIGYSQHVFTSERYGISFESSVLLEAYETESSNVLGYESNDYAVDIEVFTFDEEPASLLKDAKLSAEKTAEMLGLKSTQDGGSLPNIKNAYYVLSYEIAENETSPVFVAFIIDEKQKLVFEVTTYCYNKNLEEGKRITESFKLTK